MQPADCIVDLQVLDSWPSSTTLDAHDALHGDLSSTWSSVQQYALADEISPGYIPTPDAVDVRPTKCKLLRVIIQRLKLLLQWHLS